MSALEELSGRGWIPGITLLALFSITGSTLAEPTSGQEPQGLRLSPAPSLGEDFGPHFIDVDRKGRVFLLRGETLEVFPFDTAPGEEPLLQLQGPAGMANFGLIRAAVISGDAETWYLKRRQDIWLATSREAEKLPRVGWEIESLGRIRDEPVVSVLPFGIGPPIRDRRMRTGDPAPLLVGRSGSEWTTLATQGVFPGFEAIREDADLMRFQQERSTLLGPGDSNSIWIADMFRYRVRQLSAAGKILWQLQGDLEIHQEDALNTEQEEALEQQAGGATGGRTVLANRAIQRIYGLTEGPDGKLYVLADIDGLVIDRFDPVEIQMDRIHVDLDYRGAFTLAAGTDALYLASFRGQTGRWSISWEELAAARWQPVEDIDFGN